MIAKAEVKYLRMSPSKIRLVTDLLKGKTVDEAYGIEQFKEDSLPKFSKDLTLMKAVGCEECEGQGYSGRIAVHELLVNSPEIKRAIKTNVGIEKLTEIAMEQGMRNLRMDGIQKIFLGLTDLNQVNRVSA